MSDAASVIELQIKRINLADEARLIRQKEIRWTRKGREAAQRVVDSINVPLIRATNVVKSLHGHRIGIVRREARASHLAHGFLKGVPYREIEQVGSSNPDVDKVRRIAYRFRGDMSARAFNKKWSDWVTEGGIDLLEKDAPSTYVETTSGQTAATSHWAIVRLLASASTGFMAGGLLSWALH